MLRFCIYRLLGAVAGGLVLAACVSFPPRSTPKPPAPQVQPSPAGEAAPEPQAPPSTPASRGFPIIGAIATVCFVLGVGSVLVHIVLPIFPPKLTAAAIACAVGLWVLQDVLVRDMWILRVAVLLTILVFGAQWLYAHRNWQELKGAAP